MGLQQDERRERTQNLLAHRRARLVGEVGGRWSEETRLSSASWPRRSPRRSCSSHAGERNKLARSGGAQLSCPAARAFVSSLLERRTAMGSDGATPVSHEVEGDFRGLKWMRRKVVASP